jgi:hypothetical protein
VFADAVDAGSILCELLLRHDIAASATACAASADGFAHLKRLKPFPPAAAALQNTKYMYSLLMIGDTAG